MDIERLNIEAKRCLVAWRAYERDLMKSGLKGPLAATAVGWKVADMHELEQAVNSQLRLSDQLHVGTVDNRFISTSVLKQPLKVDDIKLVKVLQRRPGSSDPTGLDHIDFYCKDLEAAQKVLSATRANWELQQNDVHSWLSVRFGEVLEYEAKFVDHTVLTAAIKELQIAQKDILKA